MEKVKSKKVKIENRLVVRSVRFSVLPVLCLYIAVMNLYSQTGGAFTIEKSVIAAGGTTSAGGAFTVESSIGQPAAGSATGGQFSIFGGFFTPPNLAPTAAAVSVSGRVRMESGKGIRNVHVTLISANGESRVVLTGPFGAYRFEDVPVGTYFITVAAKRFIFINPAQILSLSEEIENIDFIGYQNRQ